MNTEQISISPILARRIIEVVGGEGTPPQYGFQYFTSGLDIYINTIEEEYLKTFIKEGGSAFKMVIGAYGEGKTHFLYSIRELAWKYNYIVAYITLSPERTPFSKLELVYKSIVSNIYSPPESPEELLSGYEAGIEAIIKKWYMGKYEEYSSKVDPDMVLDELISYSSSLSSYDSTSFKNALKYAFLSLAGQKNDDFTLILQWITGENPPKSMTKSFKIFEKIDKTTAFKMIRSLVQWVKDIGYSGLIVLMDEAEQTPSISSKEKSILLNNLRELIDECGHINFQNTMWFYAVPDESFLEGRSQIYEALRQRLTTIFDTDINPTGIKILLDEIGIDPISLLKEIGEKLASIYEVGYSVSFDKELLARTIENIAVTAYERRLTTGYKRLFVQNIIKAFHVLRKGKDTPVTSEDINM